MTLIDDPALSQRIAGLAQDALDRHQPRNYRITVVPGAILRDDDWFQVLVGTPNDERSSEFYFALAEAESDIAEEHQLQVLLVPALGD